MKALLLALALPLTISCGPSTVDADKVATAEALVEPLTEVTISEDCKDGGTYQITATLDVTEDPSKLTLTVDYTYTACIEKGSTVTGTVSYAKTQNETAPGTYSTEIDYSSALTYTGEDSTGSCNTTVAFRDQGDKYADKVSVTKICKHPFGKKLKKIEDKCKLKNKKKPKKKECKLL